MAVAFQVTFDCADPRRMAKFWAQALGYKEQDPPEGWDSWEAWAEDQGIPREQFDSISAVGRSRGPRATGHGYSFSACPSRSRSRTEYIST
jgi:hypothetical protein